MNISISLLVYLYITSVICFNIYLHLVSYIEYIIHLLQPNGFDKEYDYIIVGCGTAGSVITHRLAAAQGISVLVLEAGGDGGPLLGPPTIGPLLQGSLHDWQHETEQQTSACMAMKGKRCKLATGKIVGGSARLSNMIHIRSYLHEMVPWFADKYNVSELEKYLNELEEYDLPFERLRYKTPLGSAVLNGARMLGYSVMNPLNKFDQTGFMEPLVNQKSGARWSTSHSLLISSSPNVKILTNSLVHKILIDKQTNTASGLIFERFGKMSSLTAKRGIILTAGAIGTPKLLLLSGIGPIKHLETMKIPLVKDLPVGHNLLDHVSTGLDLVLLNKSLNYDLKNFFNPINCWNYFVNGNGPWTSASCEAVAILRSCDIPQFKKSGVDCTHPDLQFMVMPVGISSDQGAYLHKTIGITDNVWDKYFSKIVSNFSISILPIVLHPKSTGMVRLKSNNPYEMPSVDPKYFSDDRDIDVIVRGIHLIKELLKTKPMVDLGAYLNPIPFPGCEHINFDTYDYWACYIRHLTLTVYHPAGTCRMGQKGDGKSVVDHQCQVIGIKHLYVADASIFPTMLSGNINTAVALLASIFSNEIIEQILNS